MTYFTGLDLHKRSLTATTLDAHGAVVATAKMPCRPKALLTYFAQIPGDHAATVECTTGWYWVKDALAGTVDLHLAHAKGVKAISAAKVKTDSADAAMLAHLLRTDLLPEVHRISDELRPLRDPDVADRDLFGRHPAQCHLDQDEMLHRQIKDSDVGEWGRPGSMTRSKT